MTQAPVTPYLKAWGPPALAAMFPPICDCSAAPGSGGKLSPLSRARRRTVAVVTPDSTCIRQSPGSKARTRFSRSSEITTWPSEGTAPPANPVPPPRGTIATPLEQHHATTAAVSSAVPGSTTASAAPARLRLSVASTRYRAVEPGSTCSGPTSAASSRSSALTAPPQEPPRRRASPGRRSTIRPSRSTAPSSGLAIATAFSSVGRTATTSAARVATRSA